MLPRRKRKAIKWWSSTSSYMIILGSFVLMTLLMTIANHSILHSNHDVKEIHFISNTKDEQIRSLHMLLRKKNKVSSFHSDGVGDWESSNSAVLSLAAGLGLDTYKQFVGSLRATGYSGHIILGISNNAQSDVLSYLAEQNVTTYIIEPAQKCTYNGTIGNRGVPIDMHSGSHPFRCPKAYPDYKITWARFPLYKDWLEDCPSCTDGIMLTDARDAYFQADPFLTAVKLGQQHSLMLFQEHPHMVNTHWLTDYPVTSCRNHTVGETPVLCSGSTMGSRDGILKYIEAMVKEMNYWKEREECRIDMPGDDQSIHNYLYYTKQLDHAKVIPHRAGPIHVVGYQAAQIFKSADEEAHKRGLPSNNWYVKDNVWQSWLPEELGLIDRKTGLIVNNDGTPSAQIHQYDRFGPLPNMWLRQMAENNWPYNEPSFIDPSSMNEKLSLLQQEYDEMKAKVEKLQKDNEGLLKKVVQHKHGRVYKVSLHDDHTHLKQREEMIVKEGILRHPLTMLVASPDEADIVFWVSTRANTEAEVAPTKLSNLIILDFADGCSAHQSVWVDHMHELLGYFKRSFIQRDKNGVSAGVCKPAASFVTLFPYAYSGLEKFINKNPKRERKFVVTNLLKDHENYWNVIRHKIIHWTKDFVKQHNLEDKSFIGEVGKGGRLGFDDNYLNHLANSKIIVTANPNEWEGDYRLWEALLSGSLVFVDHMVILDMLPHPFIHREHLIFYDSSNQTEFNELLSYYIEHEEEARKIAIAGYQHTLDWHMPANRVDYILDTVKNKLPS